MFCTWKLEWLLISWVFLLLSTGVLFWDDAYSSFCPFSRYPPPPLLLLLLPLLRFLVFFSCRAGTCTHAVFMTFYLLSFSRVLLLLRIYLLYQILRVLVSRFMAFFTYTAWDFLHNLGLFFFLFQRLASEVYTYLRSPYYWHTYLFSLRNDKLYCILAFPCPLWRIVVSCRVREFVFAVPRTLRVHTYVGVTWPLMNWAMVGTPPCVAR